MSARGINRNPQFQFDVLSARPSASLCRVGQRFYALDTQQEFVVTPVAGGGRFWFQTSGVAGSADTTLFVNSATGSDTNGDGSSGKPFATLAKAQAVAPYLTAGKARINLIGAGPYTLATQTSGSIPVGPTGQPLVIVGDAFTQVATGSVTGGAGANVITNLAGTADQYRGMILHGLTGTGAGKFFNITTNTASATTTLSCTGGNAFALGFSPGDTFEIVQATTVVNAGGCTISNGLLGFYRCSLSLGASDLTIANVGTEVVLDACDVARTSGKFRLKSNPALYAIPFCGTSLAAFIPTPTAFALITDIGTPVNGSNTGVWFHGSTGAVSISCLDLAFLVGNFVLDNGITVSGGGYGFLLTIDVAGANASTGIVQVGPGNFQTINEWQRIALNGAALTVGWLVSSGARADPVGCAITGCTSAAVKVDANATMRLAGLTGTTGNTNVGVLVVRGGIAYVDSGNTVTGAAGDVQIDGQAAKSFALANLNGSVIRSNSGLSSAAYCFAGGFTGGAGATTVFFPMGGLATVAQNSATALRTPVVPGRLAQLMRSIVLSNGLTTTTTLTLFKAPAATGIPASTALTYSVGATTTGAFGDTTHTVQFNDGDQIDLQASNSAGGANPFTATHSVQAA